MTDDRRADDVHDDDDDVPRREAIAARLAVAPLDELARRRLVTRALDAIEAPAHPGSGRRTVALRVLAAAASVLVVVGGIAIAVRSDDDGNGAAETAGRSTEAVDEQAGDAAASAPAPPEGAGSGAADEQAFQSPVDLGDLGDVSDPADLATRVADGAAPPAATESEGQDSERGAATATGPACLPPAPNGVVVESFGTGTVDGAPVIVAVVVGPDGARRAVAQTAGSCVVVLDIPL